MNGDILYRVKSSAVGGGRKERQRSALLGVQLARVLRDQRRTEWEASRRELVEAMSAARDEGITVQRIADELGVSRQNVYQLVEGIEK